MQPRTIFTVLGVVALAVTASARASPAVTLTDANDQANPVTYIAGPFVVPTSQTGCALRTQCDDTALTVSVSPATTRSKRVVVRIDWPTLAPVPAQAYFLLSITQDGKAIATSDSSTDPQILRFGANNGVYDVHVAPSQPLGNSFTATIYLEPLPAASVTKAGPVAGFQIFAPPNGVGADGCGNLIDDTVFATVFGGGCASAGEPSIGVNWKTGTAVVGNFIAAIFISFDDSVSPVTATWVNRPPPTDTLTSSDPILFTDRVDGRTIVSQLLSDVGFTNSIGCSLSSVTTDDGLTWIPSEGCGPPAGADHQSIGGGPYHAPMAPLPPVSANAVYYCAQLVGGIVLSNATCSRSDDGGLSYGPGVVIYTSECSGIHGHPRVAPDGTVYLPNARCVGTDNIGQGVVISKDNGQTWAISVVPGSSAPDGIIDPSVATGLNDVGKPAGQESNTVYLGYCDGDGRARIAVSHDQAASWGDVADAGQAADIRNCTFPEMIAGDDNRASFFFLGTSTPGNHSAADFAGEWHGYVATTYDGGKTWGLFDATPDDPVQMGRICNAGGACDAGRNLLDFNDITLDKQGRPLFVFADGCLPKNMCVRGASPDTSRTAVDTVGRQDSCLTLFSEFDTTVGATKCAKAATPMNPVATTGVEPVVDTPEQQGRGPSLGALPVLLLAPFAALALLRRRR